MKKYKIFDFGLGDKKYFRGYDVTELYDSLPVKEFDDFNEMEKVVKELDSKLWDMCTDEESKQARLNRKTDGLYLYLHKNEYGKEVYKIDALELDRFGDSLSLRKTIIENIIKNCHFNLLLNDLWVDNLTKLCKEYNIDIVVDEKSDPDTEIVLHYGYDGRGIKIIATFTFDDNDNDKDKE